MKKLSIPLAVMSLAVLVLVGCGEAPTTGPELTAPTVVRTAYQSATLCGKCGEMKGGQACCAQGGESCAKCTLQKGAPGCCKMAAGGDVVLCSSCGEVEKSTACCTEGAESCAKCGLHAGSPGCCTLEKVATEQESPAVEGGES